jgi:hypothetical protein
VSTGKAAGKALPKIKISATSLALGIKKNARK